MINASTSTLRDSDIRRPLQVWLSRLHAEDEVEIIHELKVERPSARVDLAVLNGEVCGFEIKSDADTLGRLSRQAGAFSAVFQRVTLVTTPRHSSAAARQIPEWWGILISCPGEEEPFQVWRMAEANPDICALSMLHLLHKPELVALLASKGLPLSIKRLPRRTLIDEASRLLAADQILDGVRSELKGRSRRASAILNLRQQRLTHS